ncbi:TPA: hypothetical protein L5618_003727 [Pseudomonas aeruginosa]|uniref:hypothetical protein n=1 Tax=Pseudomonas aeruginosa TaxID=287 RepID=UPI001D193694|nr:hypothetical protein [Pseudomonas aeruginosa]MCC4280738.1 hypothetical protein [Pseudomonas aeruginosa]MEC4074263.1 hypothetical protein [Pseudomonas aeruginosa]HBO2702605.1 hypothetical protein [Pseudomonas aeruginosa]HBP4591486.1 hypothetical protein [Pseudomonas aeruginosa]HBP4857494.1 hypothetical protein [Pseudomonas aeruginosa]
MSVEQVRSALEKFISGQEAKAIVLKGDWGTGKTYLWDSMLKQKKEKISRRKYSYVSLFGLSNLSDLKRGIFENVVSSETADVSGDFRSLMDNVAGVGQALDRAFRKGVRVTAEAASIPFVKGLGGVVDAVSFASVSDSLICIDDYERKSSGLSGREILGLISHLVEKKNCSVILILNQGQVTGDAAEYLQFSEKVFDYEVEFSPTPEEAANIVFNYEDDYERKAIEKSLALGISNIRLLKKVKYFSGALRDVLVGYPDAVVRQVLNTLTLAVWSIYSSDPDKVAITAIREFGGGGFEKFFEEGLEDEGGAAQNLKNKSSNLLREYGFIRCDELDEAVISLVEKGYLDEAGLRMLAEKAAENVKHNEDVQLLQEAWRVYRCSFRDDEGEIIAGFERAIAACLNKMSVMDLDSICFFYRGVGRIERLEQVVDSYFVGMREQGVAISRREIFRWPGDVFLSEALTAYIESSRIVKKFEDYIIPYAGTNGLDRDDYLSLSCCEVEEFYNFFAGSDSENLHSWISFCLGFATIRASDEESQRAFEQIFVRAFEAILRVRAESNLNALRTNVYMSYQDAYDTLVRKS